MNSINATLVEVQIETFAAIANIILSSYYVYRFYMQLKTLSYAADNSKSTINSQSYLNRFRSLVYLAIGGLTASILSSMVHCIAYMNIILFIPDFIEINFNCSESQCLFCVITERCDSLLTIFHTCFFMLVFAKSIEDNFYASTLKPNTKRIRTLQTVIIINTVAVSAVISSFMQSKLHQLSSNTLYHICARISPVGTVTNTILMIHGSITATLAIILAYKFTYQCHQLIQWHENLCIAAEESRSKRNSVSASNSNSKPNNDIISMHNLKKKMRNFDYVSKKIEETAFILEQMQLQEARNSGTSTTMQFDSQNDQAVSPTNVNIASVQIEQTVNVPKPPRKWAKLVLIMIRHTSLVLTYVIVAIIHETLIGSKVIQFRFSNVLQMIDNTILLMLYPVGDMLYQTIYSYIENYFFMKWYRNFTVRCESIANNCNNTDHK